MKPLVLSMCVLAFFSAATAQTTLNVYEADGITPFDSNSQDVMVGTRLTLVVSSDSNEFWNGGLFIDDDRHLGVLSGRGHDPNTGYWTGSCLESAGELARVTYWEDSSLKGFDLYTYYPVDGNSMDNSTEPGEWFVIDYFANDVGQCDVGIYDYNTSWDDPNEYITFNNVPTRDLYFDYAVDFVDFALFASQWDASNCSEPNWCSGADLDRNGSVDYNDLNLFVEYWLWGASEVEPNNPYPYDPNVTYRIVDANGNSEITIDVNESITLYVDMDTNEPDYVSSFDIEVNISDTNLGSIDNRGRVVNDPNASTARILVIPDNSLLKTWGQGLNQAEGIHFVYLTFGSPISDGHLASFVFTCKGEGDVELDLLDYSSSSPQGNRVYPTLKSILIHQVDPNQGT